MRILVIIAMLATGFGCAHHGTSTLAQRQPATPRGDFQRAPKHELGAHRPLPVDAPVTPPIH